MSYQDNRVPGGVAQNDQVEINLSGRDPAGGQYEMKEMDPYSEGKDMNRPSDLPVNHKDIDVNAFSGAQYANQKSDDPNMYSTSENKQSIQFQKGTCYTPACMAIRRIFNLIGCIFAIGNSAFDLLYFVKSPFSSKTLYFVAIVAVVFRMIVNFGVCHYYYTKWVWNYRPGLSAVGEMDAREEEGHENRFDNQDQDQDQNRESTSEIESKKNGVWLYSMLHLLFYTGSYRLMPSVHFSWEMAIAYAIDLFLGILPIMFIQILNHSSLPNDLTPLQSIAMVIKLVSLLVFIVEVFIMIWEIILNRRMRKYKIEGFQKISEESRRKQYSRKYAGCGCVTFVLYVVIVILGLILVQSRNEAVKDQILKDFPAQEKLVGQTIELGVLVNCSAGCLDCEGDSSQCRKCEKGLYPSTVDGSCRDCDEYDDQIICKDCQEREDKQGADCNECKDGYVLINGVCEACKVNRCADCSKDLEKCNSCFEGQVFDPSLENQRCISCELEGDDMAHCQECSVTRTQNDQILKECLKCQPGIASLKKLSSNGLHRCFNCLNGFEPKIVNGQQVGCYCNPGNDGQTYGYQDANSAKCEHCSVLIPGCQKCMKTSTKPANSFYVTIQEEKVLDDDVVQPAEYVYCATSAQGLYPYKRNGVTTYKKCEQIQKGCKPNECWYDGSACHHCKSGWYQIQTNVIENGQRKNRCGWCGVKRIFGEGCQECNLSQGCTKCGEGKWKFGYKCINKLW